MRKCFSLFHDDLAAGLNKMRKRQVRKVMLAGIGTIVYFQKYKQMDHTFCHVLVGNELVVRYLNGASFVQKMFEVLENKKYAVTLAVSRYSPFEVQLYSYDYVLGRLHV